MDKYEIAAIPGDGIGCEVVPEAIRVINSACDIHGGLSFKWTSFPWGCSYYQQFGKMMADDGIHTLRSFQHIFLGAVGMPGVVPDHVSLWGLLIKIRREMRQAINVRPVKRLRGMNSPLKSPNHFDFIVVRENSEGEYSEIGGRIHSGDQEIAIQTAVFTRKATERAVRYAFQLAERRRRHVTSATKSNGIVHSMPFWDEVFQSVSKEYDNVNISSVHIDALSAFFISKPQTFDVIVASNLFGDILTDLGGAIMGSIGIAPAANLNVEGNFPSMFEPVHGSAPDIAGKGIANPIGQIWTGVLMLEHLGYEELGQLILESIQDTLEQGVRTPDLGGNSRMHEVTDSIIENMRRRV